VSYSRDDKRFIGCLVGLLAALMLLLKACEESMRYSGPTIDDGRDAAAEDEER